MANKKLTKADLKRMEQLSAKIAGDKKAIATEKQKVSKMKKELDSEKKKLASQWKELKNQKKQSQLDQKFKAGVADKNTKKGAKGGGGGNIKKLQEQLLEMKTKFNAEGKRARQFKQQVDQLTAENKVLQRKLKNLQGRKEKGEDPRIRNLLRENKQLKKQIKMLMIELNKKRRWFQRCIKSFKASRSRWIKEQEDTFKKKGYLIRYVFLDDVKQIKAYKEAKKGSKKGKKFKNKIKVKSRDGGVIVLKDVEIVVLDGDDFESDDANNKGGKKSKGKKKKSAGDKLDEMEAYLAKLEKEIDAEHEAIGPTNDDYKDMDSDADDDDDDDFDIDEDIGDLDGDYTMEQLSVDANASNIDDNSGNEDNGTGGGGGGGGDNTSPQTSKKKKVKAGSQTPGPTSSKLGNKNAPQKGGRSKTPVPQKGGGGGGSGYGKGNAKEKTDYLGLPVQSSIDSGDTAALGAQLVYLKKEMDDRTDDIEKMKEILSDGDKYPEPEKEMKQYILNINKRGDELVAKLDKELHVDQDDIKQMKANNDRWILWLNNLCGAMAKNGTLLNQLMDGIYDYYIKELKGRIDDLQNINQMYYVDKTEESQSYDILKTSVDKRHNECDTQFAEMLNEETETESKTESKTEDEYGMDNKENQALDMNRDKVKEIRNNLVDNNNNWKQLIGNVASDYENANQEKGKLVNGLNDASNELKELLDLVYKIPKRKILENEENENENENENEEEAAVGADD